jgi:4-hydroxy-tetrahydrodipicolinate synthase
MKEVRKFQGIILPTITVFDSKGEIDEEKTKKFIHYLITEGINGIFIAGSTGEYSLMSMEQRKEMIDIGVKAAEGKVPVLAGTGHNSTTITIELSKYADAAGADAVVVALPHYPQPLAEGLYQHYKTVAEAINIPVFVYSWHEQYGYSMSPEMVARLAKDGYIGGIKDTHENIDHTAEIIRLTKGTITVLEGYENKLLPALCLGADGSICTIGNLIPAEMVEIHDLFRKGNLEKAREKQLAIFELSNLLATRHDCQLLKDGIKLLGHDVGDALMPTSKVPSDIMEKVKEELKKLGRLK